MTIVFSPPALGKGSSPSSECASTNPAWNGDFWKIEEDDGLLGEVETNISGAITLATDGGWTNNNEDPVFRVVIKTDDDDDGQEVLVLSGMWDTGEGGTIDVTSSGLDHVTFCSTSEVAEEPESTTTTTSPATTTTAGATTTTSAGPTTTTSAGPTTTTAQDTTAAAPVEPTTTTPSGDTTTNATANPTEVSNSELTNDASQGAEPVEGSEGSESDDSGLSPDTNRDTTAAGVTNSGEAPALGQESSDAAPYVFRNPNHWTLTDFAILGALIAAVVALLDRKRLRRLVGNLRNR